MKTLLVIFNRNLVVTETYRVIPPWDSAVKAGAYLSVYGCKVLKEAE